MTKKRAYTSPMGTETKSAQEIKEIRDKVYNGQPYPRPLYSMHPPGQRKPVHHVNKGRTGYFSYNPNGGPGSAAGGESLNHWLFKEILYGLKNSQLSLSETSKRTENAKHWWKETITITHAEKEKPILRKEGGRPLFSDIYIEFESKNWLSEKWEGKVYIEIRNTHPIEADKQDALRELGVPVIEVDIRESPYAYPVDEDDTTDEHEQAHIKRVRNMLQHENGFLQAIVLNNPSSAAFLQKVVRQKHMENQGLKGKLQASEAKAREDEDARNEASQQLLAVRGSLETVMAARDEQQRKLTHLCKELKSKTSENEQLAQDVQTSRLNFRLFAGLLVMSFCLNLYLLYLEYFPPSNPAEAQPAATATATPTPITPTQPVDMKPATPKAHAKHHSSMANVGIPSRSQ